MKRSPVQTHKTLEQAYVIMQKNCSEMSIQSYYEFVFTNYSESRQTAKKIIDGKNHHIQKQNGDFNSYGLVREFTEIAPDTWSNGTEIISIIVFKKKDLDVIRKPTKNKESRIMERKEKISHCKYYQLVR